MYQTPWGYTVSELPPLMTANELMVEAPNLSSTTDAIAQVLASASFAVRDWCGWHISPSLECVYTGHGEGRLLMLPAMGVTSVRSVTVDGEPVEFEWTASGMVRLVNGTFPDRWRSVVVTYTAGFDDSAVSQAVAQIALNALTASPGVREEHAGQVGITYNATGSGVSGGVALLERDRAMLAPYRLIRAW